jgi:nucleoside-diphosphate-sugar epimerase
MQVLVTGAAGLVGGSVCRRLVADGHDVTAIWHRVEPGSRAEIRSIRADLRNVEAVGRLPHAEAVVHCAAVLPASFEDSTGQADVNRAIDVNVFEWGRRCGAAVVYASGTSLYDHRPHPARPFRENDPVYANGPYLEEKWWAEQYGAELASRGQIAFTVLRLSAPYGPRQRAATVVWRFIDRALAGGPLEYWGDGSRRQDFTYADDAGAAFCDALTGPGGTFNIASGSAVSMRELAAVVADVVGLDPDAVRPAMRPDPQAGSPADYDIDAAREKLGWTPTVSIRDGIAECVAERVKCESR